MDRKQHLSSEDISLDGYSDSSREQSHELFETVTASLLQSASRVVNDDKTFLKSRARQPWPQTTSIKTEEFIKSEPPVPVKIENCTYVIKHEPNFKLDDSKPVIKQEDTDSSNDRPIASRKSTSKRKRKSKKEKTNRTYPANAREFVAQLHSEEDAWEEMEDSGQDMEGSGEEEEANPQKSQKTSQDSQPNKKTTNREDTDPEMKNQFKQMMKSIPEGCDTRHEQTQHEELMEAKELFGHKKVREKNGKYLLSGMKTGLLPHQLVASAWMVKRELARTAPYGGLLADEMGFGKTVVSLNTIVGNPPLEKDIEDYSGTTLIVVPNRGVARQWQSEILKHIEKPGVMIINSNANMWAPEQYEQCWVIIVTYADLVRQYIKKAEARALKEIYGQDSLALLDAKWPRCGSLFHCGWYRVILDEAHCIKSHRSSMASACWDLNSKFRWALSGSPLANSDQEFYSYFKFLGCNFVGNFATFRNMYCSEETRQENFDALISLITFRRTLKDKFLGSQIISLPDKECQDIWIPLSKEEQIIYDVVDTHFRQLVDAERKRREAEKNGIYIDEESQMPDIGEYEKKKVHIPNLYQARYMRLRQAVSHLFGLENCFRNELDPGTIQELRSQLRRLEQVPLREQLKNSGYFATGSSKYSHGLKLLESMSHCAFGGMFDIRVLLTLARNDALCNNATCGICNKPSSPLTPIQSAHCEHFYCEACLLEKIMKLKPDSPRLKCLIPNCSQPLEVGTYRPTLTCIDKAARICGEVEYGRDSNGVYLPRKKGKKGEKGKDVAFLASISEKETGVNMPPSSKLTAAMAVILTWLAEAPNDKIIVFTDFVTTCKVLGRMLQMEGIPFLFYNGRVGPLQKEKALESFKKDPNQMILLASLRAAGQSLNLTEANRVIIVDPWYNKSQEQQAFCRVHRIGQKKKTYLVRLLTMGGIDERITELQNTKSMTIDATLQDDGHVSEMPALGELEYIFRPREEKQLKKSHKP